jgi:pyruvate/2-oxoglutarate dehydrogenase complex dihydrolipoamide dehydrogenase (E3) component
MEAEAVVVGLGPGGEQMGEDLASAGMDVVGIESELVGGECRYWGCIPSKMRPDADYRAVPHVTFTDPEIGSVGLTEARAREAGGDVRVYRDSVGASARGWIHRAEGLVKLVARDGVVVGGTFVGPGGGEMLGLLSLAVHASIPVETIRTMIFAYPTFHRALDSALWPPVNEAKMAGA